MNMHSTIAAIAPAHTPSTWQLAMHHFEAARSAETAFDRRFWMPAYNVGKSDGAKIPDSIDDKMTELTDLRCDAEDALIATPAPNLSACIWKIEYARERWSEFEDFPSDWWAAIMSDLRRLDAARGGC